MAGILTRFNHVECLGHAVCLWIGLADHGIVGGFLHIRIQGGFDGVPALVQVIRADALFFQVAHNIVTEKPLVSC